MNIKQLKLKGNQKTSRIRTLKNPKNTRCFGSNFLLMYSRTVNLFVRRNVILCNRNSVVWLKQDDCNRSIYSFTFLNPGKLFALCCAGRGLDTFNEFEAMLSDNTMMNVLPKHFQSPLFVVLPQIGIWNLLQ